MSDPILILEGVEKHFGHVAVLRGISAAVPEGSITAFVGPNGAGKTTLFHTITGDLHIDAGTVLFRGRSIGGWPRGGLLALGSGNYFRTSESSKALPCLKTSY